MATAAKQPCAHCTNGTGSHGKRMLCYRCYGKAEIRNLYPVVPRRQYIVRGGIELIARPEMPETPEEYESRIVGHMNRIATALGWPERENIEDDRPRVEVSCEACGGRFTTVLYQKPNYKVKGKPMMHAPNCPACLSA